MAKGYAFCAKVALNFKGGASVGSGVAPPIPGVTEALPDVFERTREQATTSPTAIAADKRRHVEGRTVVPSLIRPPISESDVIARLLDIDWRLNKVEGKGNCVVLSALAGNGIKDTSQLLVPSVATLKLVQKARYASVSIIVGVDQIGGLPSKTFRAQEGLCQTPQAAAREMKMWRANHHWLGENPHESAAFIFGLGVSLERQIIVLEQSSAGGIVEPSKIYAAREGGSLLRSKATSGKPECVISWGPISFKEILAKLKTDGQETCSVLLFDGVEHFDPFIFGVLPPPSEVSPELVLPAPEAVLLPGEFVAHHKPSAKAPIGTKLFTIRMAWNSLMMPGSKLTFFVPPMAKSVTTTLVQKPPDGNLILKIQLPAEIIPLDSFLLGECSIVNAPPSGPPMGMAMAQLTGSNTSLPFATAVPIQPNMKRSAEDAQEKPMKKKPAKEPETEPDFALEGYTVLPPPKVASADELLGKLVAHRFSISSWSPGWCVGKIQKQSTAKRTLDQFEVNYGRQFSPAVYIHKLLLDQYGQTKNWVLVAN